MKLTLSQAEVMAVGTTPQTETEMLAALRASVKPRSHFDQCIDEANRLAHLRCMVDDLIQQLAREPQRTEVTAAIATLGLLTFSLLQSETEAIRAVEIAQGEELTPSEGGK